VKFISLVVVEKKIIAKKNKEFVDDLRWIFAEI